MKKTILTSIMSLFMAFNVFAGGDNSVYIDQTNADNSTVNITQTGANNTVGDPNNVGTPSFEIEGNSMLFTILKGTFSLEKIFAKAFIFPIP